MDINGEINRNTVIVRDFNTLLTSKDRSFREKINRQTADLSDIPDQMDLIDIFRTFHPKAPECTYFSNAHGKFSRRDHMLRHKISFSKFRNIEIISSIFSDHNAIKLETSRN